MNAPVNKQMVVDAAAIQPLPNSRKIYVEGSRPDIQVPMREIRQADTPTQFGGEKNPPIFVYDTSGPYSDPAARIDIQSGLAPLRAAWIAERGDCEQLPACPANTAAPAKPTPSSPSCASICSASRAAPRPAAT
ncbi:Phosphomethylpyrimidine synthase [Chromobacterium violaceum]|uniref:Phosphomethylpyrimidine synthase n=1 Tax=Chromobacterium violaceum TaxID=536 RepID=A0A3S4HEB5_CHRVL|nr:Phosphomethylpyrimidine synthase [Chromobacterium violaceum]